MKKLKILDLFSGIGGFSLGLEATGGFETSAFCDIDPYCRKVLQQHWPNVPIFEDIKKLKGTDIGTVDIITGGYPCQPFSVAGKQKGVEDKRHLWPEYFRLIKECRPTLNSVWTPLSRTWRVKVTPQGRLVFQLQALVPITKEKESGLLHTEKKMWPTPTASMMPSEGSIGRYRKLVDQGVLTKEEAEQMQMGSLNPARMKPWTPLLPTPTVNDSKNNGGPAQHKRKTKALNVVAGGKLNPTWVEWLMGYPTEWTDLKHSETV